MRDGTDARVQVARAGAAGAASESVEAAAASEDAGRWTFGDAESGDDAGAAGGGGCWCWVPGACRFDHHEWPQQPNAMPMARHTMPMPMANALPMAMATHAMAMATSINKPCGPIAQCKCLVVLSMLCWSARATLDQ